MFSHPESSLALVLVQQLWLLPLIDAVYVDSRAIRLASSYSFEFLFDYQIMLHDFNYI